MEIVMTVGVILLIAALFLIIAVLMQNSKSHKLSGTIAGGAETFFGKTKGATIDKKLNTLTAIVAVIFVVLVAVMYIIQPDIPTTIPENVVVEDTVVDSEAVESEEAESFEVESETEPVDVESAEIEE